MPGPRPKPTEIKKLQGNPGRRRLNFGPKFTGKCICPSWLSKVAKAEWRRVAKQLAALNMLRAVDSSALAAYCQSFSRWKEAEALVTKFGMVIEEPIVNKNGDVVGERLRRNPADIARRDALKIMQQQAALFGFDPSSRTKVKTEPVKEDPFASFMAGGSGKENSSTNRKPS